MHRCGPKHLTVGVSNAYFRDPCGIHPGCQLTNGPVVKRRLRRLALYDLRGALT